MGGNDFRQIWKARENNPHFFRENNPAWDKRIDKKLRSMAKNIKYCATDPEMLEHAEPYFEKVFLFRQPVDFTYQDFRYPDPEEKKPVILHIPTNPWVKGTNYLLKAIEKLEQEKIPFTFKYIRNLTQKEMANALLEADIYVDELLIGGHGVTAVESLAAGKPTITYIREDLLKKYPEDMPIISANPDTIYKELKRLILEPKQRYQIGVASREYAKKYHDIRVVCNDLLKIYKEIGFR
jgi:glycosyltransferase involved in cell wall biosynthesis